MRYRPDRPRRALVYVAVVVNVGRARGEYKIAAPRQSPTTAEFERVYRVQMNTVEQLVAFVPALWLYAVFLSAPWATAIGAVWVVGRIVYAISYCIAPREKRGPGFVLTFVPFAILWMGALWGVIATLLRG